MTEPKPIYTANQMQVIANAINRRAFARAMGGISAYRDDRDYYEVLGYNSMPRAEDYRERYERQDIAKRIVDLPAVDTWKLPPKISEDDDEDTPFVQAWQALVDRLRIWNVMTRVDSLSGIGHYGIILVGLRDGKDLKEEVLKNSLSGGKENGVLFLRTYSEEKVQIDTWVTDKKSARFGMPLTYRIDTTTDVDGDFPGTGSVTVHWTRVIHVAEGRLDSETFGTPRLQSVLNLLDDQMKVIGGTAEATWLNMRPGVAVKPKESYDYDDGIDATKDFLVEIERYAHDPLRVMRAIGMDVETIGTAEVMDPTGPADIILSRISAATGIPQRVLTGSAAGELAAAQEDTRQWASFVSSRQTNYAEPQILRLFIDRLIWYGILPLPPNGYDVGTLVPEKQIRKWPSIIEQTEAERAKIVLDRANAIEALTDPVTLIVPTTEEENRELLGYPPEKSETEPSPSLPDDEPVAQILRTARENYRANGNVTSYVSFLVGELQDIIE